MKMITKRSGITRSKLRRMGYRRGATCYFKRRLCRSRTTTVLVQVQAFQSSDWKRGDWTLFNVNSREYPIKGKSSLEYSGPEQSQVSTVAELRDWERFAFQP